MASLQQTQEQERAAAAWKRISEQVKGTTWAGEYRTLVRSATTDILTNGLGQTLAFLLAKDKGAKGNPLNPHWALSTHLAGWIANRDGRDANPKFSNVSLLKWLTGEGSDVYRQTTVEVIAYLNWLKRFAEAELPEPKEH